MKSVAILLLALAWTSFIGCSSDGPRIEEFKALRAEAMDASAEMRGAAYLYMLETTPEWGQLKIAIDNLQSRNKEAMLKGVVVERVRREKYIDSFEIEIKDVHDAAVRMTQVASSMQDLEIRESALQIISHYERVTDINQDLLQAQRAKSIATERLFELAAEGSTNNRLQGNGRELEDANERSKECWGRLGNLESGDDLLFAEFLGLVERKQSRFSWR